jgi:hypothetical protein
MEKLPRYTFLLTLCLLLGIVLYFTNQIQSLPEHTVSVEQSELRVAPRVVIDTELLNAAQPLAGELEPDLSTELSLIKGAEGLPQSEQASLWQAFSESRRAIRPLTEHQEAMEGNEGAHFLASNPSQKIRARFLDDGVRLLSGYPNRDWSGVIGLDSEAVAEIRHEGTQLEYARLGIVEWYHNNRAGIEHGFIVEQRSFSAADGQLVISVQVSGLSVQALEGREAGSSDLQFVDLDDEPVLSYTGLKVRDATGTPLMGSMQPTAEGLQILVADFGAVYPITIDPLIASGAF